MKLNRSAVVLLAIVAILSASLALAQRDEPRFAQREARLPVIVVLQDDQVFAMADSYRPDDRALANPDAWAYLDRGVAGYVQSMEHRLGFRSEHVYSAALKGFAARLTARQIDLLEHDPSVAYIEPDGEMHLVAQTLPWGIDKVDADISSTRAGDGTGAITNVNVYVIDTGVDASHTDLNAVMEVNFAGGPKTDCNGHGTHVSGTVGAKDNTQDVVGVAPGVRVHGVKVLSCSGSGSTSGVIKGIDWVTANAIKPAVANMSLGGGVSTSLDDAVKRSVASGVTYAIAAGNDGADACNSSPARAGTTAGVITVAATDSSDKETSWSNYGGCVDIWAPGLNILSTKKGGGTTTMSGTSMATPHVAGGAALYLSSHTSASPSSVESALKSSATTTANKSKNGATIKRLWVGSY